MATSRRHLLLAATLQLLGVGIVAAWVWALLPFWRRTGPAPGTGAQYGFVLVPTIGIAGAALATSAFLVSRVRRRDPARRTPATLAVLVLSAVAGCVLLAWFGWAAVVAFSPAT